jgi:uncharacterized phiE125 gp8 family phage protein
MLEPFSVKNMALKIFAAPAVEPITLQEAKAHLRLNSGTFSEAFSVNQSIAPGSHAIAPSYSLKGVGVNVSLAADAIAILEAGTCAGIVNAKLQESNTDVDANYVDVPSGAFPQITTANDNATYELVYSGTKIYVRVVATVAGAACEFGAAIVLNSPTHAEDSLVAARLQAARLDCELFQRRAYITQTWDLYLDEFPNQDYIEVPLPPLQTVSWVKYKSTAGTLLTFDPAYYIVDTFKEPGRIALAYGQSWPTTYGEIQDVQIRFICGSGLAADVPQNVKSAILLKLGGLYEHRGDAPASEYATADPLERAIEALLWPERIVRI